MKFDILFVEIMVAAAVAVPYMTFILLGLRESARLKKEFLEVADKLQLRLEEKDSWNKNVIGLDKENAKILLLQQREEAVVTKLIDLRQVRACSILEDRRTMIINKRMEEVLQKLDLQLILHDGSMELVNLFDCEVNYSQDHELKHAERWNHCINRFISYASAVNSAA